jgi:hypothetical protein
MKICVELKDGNVYFYKFDIGKVGKARETLVRLYGDEIITAWSYDFCPIDRTGTVGSFQGVKLFNVYI